jgi:hypothetical protein
MAEAGEDAEESLVEPAIAAESCNPLMWSPSPVLSLEPVAVVSCPGAASSYPSSYGAHQ